MSAAGYDGRVVRSASNAQRRYLSNHGLLIHVKAVYAQMPGAYGWPRIWRTLLAGGIRAKGKPRFKATTDSNQDLTIAPNLRERQFIIAKPDQVWVGDITFIAAEKGWPVLGRIKNLFGLQLVS